MAGHTAMNNSTMKLNTLMVYEIRQAIIFLDEGDSFGDWAALIKPECWAVKLELEVNVIIHFVQ
jgi:hypothetical protein